MHKFGTAGAVVVFLVAVPMVAFAAGPAPVPLRSAGNFVILSKTGITNVPTSAIIGNVGTSPITGAANHLTCGEVTGRIFSVDAAGAAPCNQMDPARLTTAVGDMQTAYANAAGRPANFINLAGGNIGGRTLAPGVYKWTTGVTIPTNVYLSGSSTDTWIFQIAGNLNVADSKRVILLRGAQPMNIFWQVAGQATLGTTSQFQGIILSKTMIAMNTRSSINGRLYAQTAVTLQKNVVTRPLPTVARPPTMAPISLETLSPEKSPIR